eukprot:6459897-Amphidinium_carterae.2
MFCVWPYLSSSRLWQPMAGTIADSLPKKSTIKRARYYLDFALTVGPARRFPGHQNVARYWWTDASPLTGREWLACRRTYIDHRHGPHGKPRLGQGPCLSETETETSLVNGSEYYLFAEALDSVSPELVQQHRHLQEVIHNYIYAPAVRKYLYHQGYNATHSERV